MNDVLGMLLSVAQLVGVGLLVVTVVALARVGDVAALRRRVAALEDEVRRRRRPRRDDEAEDAVPVAEIAAPTRRPARPDAGRLEGVIGRQVLGWAAAVLLLFAVGFFVKYAFENEWIGPAGQVCCGAALGAGLCAGGFAARRRRLASQMLTGAGASILYLAAFATFGFYEVLPRERASVYLCLLVALSAGLAVVYDARSIGWMALAGGLLAPALLASDRDQYHSLFAYLTALSAGALAMSLARGWRWLALAALAGTQGTYWLWFDDNFHPDKRAAVLVFQSALWALFLLHDAILPTLWRRPAGRARLAGLPLSAFAYAGACGVALGDEPWALLSALAVGLSVAYVVLTSWVLARSPDDARLPLASVAVGLSFLAAAVALRAEAGWVALGWAVEGLALWWFGLRVRSLPLRALGGVLLSLALARYLAVDAPWQARHLEWPVLNRDALPGLVIAACLIGAGWLTSRLPHVGDVDRLFRAAGSLCGVVLAWLVLSLEVHHFATTRWPDETGTAVEGFQRAQAGLSVFWAAYAGAVMAAGFWRKLLPLRVLALCLFGLTMLKLFFIDMAGLPGIYRVAAFFALSVVLAGAAYAYQRYERSPRPDADASQDEEFADVPS